MVRYILTEGERYIESSSIRHLRLAVKIAHATPLPTSETNLPKVISLHLEVEDLALGIGGVGNEIFVKESEHVVANVAKLGLHLLTVLAGHSLTQGFGSIRENWVFSYRCKGSNATKKTT